MSEISYMNDASAISDAQSVTIRELPSGAFLCLAESSRTGETWAAVGRNTSVVGYAIQAALLGEALVPAWEPGDDAPSPYVVTPANTERGVKNAVAEFDSNERADRQYRRRRDAGCVYYCRLPLDHDGACRDEHGCA